MRGIRNRSTPMKTTDRVLGFEEFQRTRTPCADLGQALADARWPVKGPPGKGFLYCCGEPDKDGYRGGLYIEEIACHPPTSTNGARQYLLIIGNYERVSEDLAALELDLYDFAVREGYCDKQTGETSPQAGDFTMRPMTEVSQDPVHETDVDAMVDAAFAALAALHPECTSGDMNPEVLHRVREVLRAAAEHSVEVNQ